MITNGVPEGQNRPAVILVDRAGVGIGPFVKDAVLQVLALAVDDGAGRHLRQVGAAETALNQKRGSGGLQIFVSRTGGQRVGQVPALLVDSDGRGGAVAGPKHGNGSRPLASVHAAYHVQGGRGLGVLGFVYLMMLAVAHPDKLGVQNPHGGEGAFHPLINGDFKGVAHLVGNKNVAVFTRSAALVGVPFVGGVLLPLENIVFDHVDGVESASVVEALVLGERRQAG